MPAHTTPSPASGRRILIVEDHEILARFLSRALASFGGHVTVAGSIAEAWTLIEGGDFAVIVSDHHLPDGNGMVFLRALRRNHPKIRRVLFTADSALDLRATVQEGTAEFALLKPVPLRAILTAVGLADDESMLRKAA